MIAIQRQLKNTEHDNYQHLIPRYDRENAMVWCYMQPSLKPCFTPELLEEMRSLKASIEDQVRCDQLNTNTSSLRYQVLASRVPGIFNLGGDLALFLEAIRTGNQDRLSAYATSCIDMVYGVATSYNLPLTTISLVQGEALGGGFEAALASNVLIAERGSKMGLPEILFNLFPGMGAYTLLSRRLDPARAEKIILSGKMYTSEELYEIGVVDVLANPGEGEQAVYTYISKQNQMYGGCQALRRIRQRYQPIDYQELLDITADWVDTAMQLPEKDLRTMDRLAHSQKRLDQSSRLERRAPDSPLRVRL